MSIPIQDSVIRSDSSNAGKLVLVDTQVQDKDVFLNSVKTNVSAIILDFKNDTYNSILTKIKNNMIHDTLESIALVSHGQYNDNYSFLEKENSPKLKNISLVDPNFNSWKGFLDFLIKLKDLTSIKYLDLLGCAIVSYNEWKLILTYLESNSGIKVRASADNTGNLVVGGNWILETDNIDAKELYFTDKILNFTALLIVAPVISISPLNIVNTSGANTSPFSISIPSDFTATSYQWYSSTDNITFVAISQANTASYTPSDTTRHITYYYCKLNNTYSSPKVYLLNSYKLLPSTTTISTPLIIISNSVNVSNIKWQSSPDNNSWNDISGAIAKNYIPNNTVSGKYINFTCDFTYNSNTRTITSNSTQILLNISKQPINIIKTSTGTNTKPFTITANVATYQWQISNSTDSNSFTNITGVAGALTATYLPIESSDSTQIITYYRCHLNGCAYSEIVYLLSDYRIITQQPANIINNLISDSNSFNIAGLNYSSLKWQRLTSNSTFADIDGATSDSFTPDHTSSIITYYRCRLNINILGTPYSYYSNTVYLLNAYLLLPSTSIYGTPLTVITGASTIQWRIADTNTSNPTPINQATSTTFKYNNTVNNKYISYTCSFKYNNSTTSITSNSTQILPINITLQPSNYIISPNTINTNSISNIIVNNNNSGNDFNITLANSGTNITSRWEISRNNKLSFEPIIGANNLNYSPSSNITIAYYRCMLNQIYPSESVFLLNTNLLLPISTKAGDLLETISKITNIKWQKSDNNSSWSDISGATSTIYIPDDTLSTKYIRYTFTFNNINNINSNSTIISSRTGGPVDNNSYLTAGVANSTFLPLAGGTLSGSLEAKEFVKSNSTAEDYLMGNGSTSKTDDVSLKSKYFNYNVNNTDASLANSGFVAFNHLSFNTNTTEVYLSTITRNGVSITDYFPSLGTGVGYYLYVYDANNLTKYVKYYITGITDVASSVVSNPNDPPATITIPASKIITVRINPSAVSGDFKADLDTSQSPAVPRKVLVSIMADATEIDTRLATLETVSGIKSASTVLIESIVTADTQTYFNALDVSKTYIDMRYTNTVTTTAYTAGRTFGCSFTVIVSGSNKVPVLSASYTNLPTNISVKNPITNTTYDTWTKSVTGDTWVNYYNMVRSPAEVLKIIRGCVNDSGTILSGAGFSVVYASTGRYTITFSGNPFSVITKASIVATVLVSGSGSTAIVDTNSTTSTPQTCLIQTTVPGVNGFHTAVPFSFIAIGT